MSTTRSIKYQEHKWYWYTLTALLVGWAIGTVVIHFEFQCHRQTLLPKTLVYSDPDENPDIPNAGELDAPGRIRQKPSSKKKFLYIAMMSADKFVRSRVKAAADTWASSIRTWNKQSNVDVEVFAQSNFSVGHPVIRMPGVSDNVYPPQKKSFSMMRYVYDNHLTEYEWFLRLDDDAYVHIEHLESLLRRINSSDSLYIGSPGFGRDNDDFVEDNMVYCMGGPGIVFSTNLLQELSPNLGDCLKNNLMTEHEDIELGRCVFHHTGVGCTKSYEMGTLFKNNYNVEETDTDGLKPVFEEVAAHSATYHANKIQENQYSLHNTVMLKKIQKLRQSASDLEKDVDKMRKEILDTFNDPKFYKLPHSRSLVWQQITSGKHYSLEYVSRGILQPWVNVVTELAREAAKTHYKEKKLHGKIERIHVDRVYQATSEYATEFLTVIDMKHISSGKDSTITAAFRAKRRFLNLMMQEESNINIHDVAYSIKHSQPYRAPNDNKIINFIIPLSGRPDSVREFLSRLEKQALSKGILVNVKVVYFSQDSHSTSHSEDELKYLLQKMQDKYQQLKFEWLPAIGSFSRGKGLQIGAMSCSDDDLLFFCDIDMQFSTEFFRRLRDNTRKGVAYYPIIFSQYDPSHVGHDPNNFNVDLWRGFWRSYGYGMVALYKEDFDKAGGFDVKIIGWGMEDVYLASNVISNNIGVMRSVDPELVHVYHDKHCDPDLSPQQLDGCIKTKFSHYGPQEYHYKTLKSEPPETINKILGITNR